ncbi:MAG: hypothetical protein MN733_01405, partial [Nitrososphaera sp.]|nr:hypothetical protein [Nitrososphaera sp.]
MSDEIFFDGIRYISAGKASELPDFTRDYIGRLCREKKVRGKRIGKNWYVDENSFKEFLIAQEYKKNKYRESLSEQRALEYHVELPQKDNINTGAVVHTSRRTDRAPYLDVASVRTSPPPAQNSPYSVGVPSMIHETLRLALERRHIARKPQWAHATRVHTPVYVLTPTVEVLNRVVALCFAVMLTFGTYAVFNPAHATHAARSIQHTVASISDSYQRIARGGVPAIQHNTSTLIAASASPWDFFHSLSNVVGTVARVLNASVDGLVYGIAFPPDLVRSIADITGQNSGLVLMQIMPYQDQKTVTNAIVKKPTPPATTVSSPIVRSSTPVANPTVVNNYQVIERIIEKQTLASVGGLTEDVLDQKLKALDDKLAAQLFSIGNANSTSLANTINNFDGISITNSTITGGSITNT